MNTLSTWSPCSPAMAINLLPTHTRRMKTPPPNVQFRQRNAQGSKHDNDNPAPRRASLRYENRILIPPRVCICSGRRRLVLSLPSRLYPCKKIGGRKLLVLLPTGLLPVQTPSSRQTRSVTKSERLQARSETTST